MPVRERWSTSQWRGLYFDLYVMLGIFSRKVMRWEVHVIETGDRAKEFIQGAIIANGGARPEYRGVRTASAG
jgi:hypothetical protein